MKLTVIVLATLVAFPLALAAAECTTDADCAPDEICARMETCAAPACPEGQECEVPACTSGGECVAAGPTGTDYVYGNACEADADCPADFVCEELDVPCATSAGCGCSCPACDPDSGAECPPCDCGECTAPDPTPCEPTTARYCAYHPRACTADSDCAEGFQCVTDEVCYGGGSTCAVPDCACACEAGAECPPCDCPKPVCDDVPVESTCEVISQYCAPKQIACADASACPAGWECVAVPAYGCACPMIDCPPVETMCPDLDPACVEKAEACDSQAACDCPATEPEAYCMPAGWGGVMAAQDGAATGDTPAPTGGAELGDFLENAHEAAAGPRVVDDKATDETSDTTGDDGNGAASDTAGGGGCTTGGAANGLGFLLLTLLALVGIDVIRRRA